MGQRVGTGRLQQMLTSKQSKKQAPNVIDDPELARRSIYGFGEMVAALGYWGIGPEAEVRRPDAVGARIDAAADNPWFDGAVVPLGKVPPTDEPRLPHCLWTVADAAPGRVEKAEIAMPCLGISLYDPTLNFEGGASLVEAPPLAELGRINERAYGQQSGLFSQLVGALQDERIRTHGLRVDGVFVSVALTFTLGDDLSIQYVATEAKYRRRGLASRLLLAVIAAARDEGMGSATLQASPDGLSVYERIGFRRVATLRAYLRPKIEI
ncbi:GNAT family N-acetyltransferase [Gloeobacter kilaueensis]|uniref:Acetyltransferase n=1 Tax=Gloeobacter kilaueensis (strain ATCC BAA-2537 / CCAP 1431/1 / ULC 316 / JS1) TaxID=1183438 RepID=U5QCS9_GLOK1|nr:GNAT family N-acetyltransferase [Gloeobacter kilaueensis]AGY56653.1 acetyltransferase [Gloeobacter kilaueensis JS1]